MKNQQQAKNVDVNSNISEKKDSMARVTQNRRMQYIMQLPTTLDKIFGTKQRNPVKSDKTSKVFYLIFRVF